MVDAFYLEINVIFLIFGEEELYSYRKNSPKIDKAGEIKNRQQLLLTKKFVQ